MRNGKGMVKNIKTTRQSATKHLKKIGEGSKTRIEIIFIPISIGKYGGCIKIIQYDIV